MTLDVVLAEKGTTEQFSDKLRMIYLQLPLFNKEADECENQVERWIYLLKNMENLNAVFIDQGLPQSERLIKLNQIAIQQMKVLEGDDNRKLIK